MMNVRPVHHSSFITHHSPFIILMHELSIVEALIDQVKQELDRAGQQGRVLRLELSIGRLSGVNPESVRFAFGLLGSGTIVENAQLAIEEPRAVCQCHTCNARTEIDDLVLQCPKCAAADVAIEGGREMTLQSIEIED
jgi:hydrogenase nickel incorporation protein HypA/HybF